MIYRDWRDLAVQEWDDTKAKGRLLLRGSMLLPPTVALVMLGVPEWIAYGLMVAAFVVIGVRWGLERGRALGYWR